MKILGIGNLNKMGELFCQIFRDLGHDADYLLWHQKNDLVRQELGIEPIKLNMKSRKEIELLKFMLKHKNEYDLFICHFSLQNAMICNLLKVNYICHTRGYDVTHSPNNKIYGWYLKNSFRNSKAIWCSTPDLVEYAKLYHKIVHFTPNVIRNDIYKPMKKRKNKRLTIFIPSRQVWNNKGIDKVVRMFKEIQKKRDAELHLIEWGEDAERTKKLVNNLGVKNVFWHELMQDQHEMVRLYNLADVVWSSFGFTGNALGLVALEAMSCNATLIINRLRKGLYPGNPPIIQCKNEKEIIEKTLDFEKFESQRKKQREWIQKYFSYNAVKKKLKECLEEIELYVEKWKYF